MLLTVAKFVQARSHAMHATTAQQTQVTDEKRRQAESEREKKAELFEVL